MPRRSADLIRPVVVLGGFLLLGMLFARLGPGRVLSLLSALGMNFVVVVLLFSTHECVRALAARQCLQPDPRPPLHELVRIRFLGEAAGALTRTGPFAAEPARARLLGGRDQQGMPGYAAAVGELAANSGVSAAVNVAVAGGVLLTTSLAGPLRVLAHVLCWGSLVYAGLVAVIVGSRFRILGALAGLASSIPGLGTRLRIDAMKAQKVGQATSSALMGRSAALARILALETSAQAILVCETFWAIRSMGAAVSVRSALFIEVMTRAVSVIQFVGATEAGYALIFTWLGMPAAVGFTLSLVKTLRSLTAAGIGIGLLTGLTRTAPKTNPCGAAPL